MKARNRNKAIVQEFDNFCHNLRVLRRRSGYTLAQMAKILKLSAAELAELEQGNIPGSVDISLCFLLSARFGIPFADQFGTRL